MKGYNDLKRELKKIWDMPVKVMPVIVAALGTTPKKLKHWLSYIGIETRLVKLQKTTILNSGRILRNVLEVWRVLLTQVLKKFNHWSKAYSVCNSNKIIAKIVIIIVIITTILIIKVIMKTIIIMRPTPKTSCPI